VTSKACSGRQTLRRLVRVGKGAARRSLHARILLLADQGPDGPAKTDTQVAEALSAHARTIAGVRRWPPPRDDGQPVLAFAKPPP